MIGAQEVQLIIPSRISPCPLWAICRIRPPLDMLACPLVTLPKWFGLCCGSQCQLLENPIAADSRHGAPPGPSKAAGVLLPTSVNSSNPEVPLFLYRHSSLTFASTPSRLNSSIRRHVSSPMLHSFPNCPLN